MVATTGHGNRARVLRGLQSGHITDPKQAISHPAQLALIERARRLEKQIEDKGFPETKQERFLGALRHYGTVRAACEATGVSYYVVRRTMRENPVFAERFKQTEDTVTDLLEEEAIRRACQGVQREALYQGQPQIIKEGPNKGKPVLITEYSDRLLEMLLKGRRYYQSSVHVSGPGGGPITIRMMPGDETA